MKLSYVEMSIPADVQKRMDEVGVTPSRVLDTYCLLGGYPRIQRQYAKIFGIQATRVV